MQDVAAFVGRMLLSVIFVWGGWGKLMAASATQAYIAKSGLPLPQAGWAVAVLVELGLGLLLLFGLFTRPAALVLAAWCVVTALVFHSDFGDRNMQIHFLKNVAMAGGLLYAAGFGGGTYSFDAMLRRRRVVSVA